MFVLDFPLSRPIYFIALRFLWRLFIFDFFRLFSWRFSSTFFYLLITFITDSFLRIWEVLKRGRFDSWLGNSFICRTVLCSFTTRKCCMSAELLLRVTTFFDINSLVYYNYQKTIVLDVFLAVLCHLNFTFSRGIIPPGSCSPPPQSGPTCACSSRFVSYKPIYFQRAIKNLSFG